MVAIVRGPSYYDPRRHADRALQRRNLVLKEMADQGIVSPQEASRGQPPAARGHARGPPGPTTRPTSISCGARCGATTTRRISPRRACASTPASSRARRMRPSTRSSASSPASTSRTSTPRQPLEGAVVVTAPQSGDVIAIVGGRDVGYDGFDRALDAHRSMGSLVKPFIYLTALETGRYNAATVVQDAPVDVKLSDGTHWKPENFTHQIYGAVPVVRALCRVAEPRNRRRRDWTSVCRRSRETLTRFGLPSPPAQVPAMLLGAVDVTPLEAAQLFNGLANGGFRNPLRAVRAVISATARRSRPFRWR